MLIWLVKIGEPLPFDSSARPLRTGMLAERLAARGHKVVWWTSAFEHHQKKVVMRDDERRVLPSGVEIRAILGMPYSKNISLRRYWDHRIIARKFRERAGRTPDNEMPDAIVAAMPDYQLAAEAVRFGAGRGIPTLVDIRDKWPDMFWEVMPGWMSPFLKIAFARDRRMLARTLSQAAGVVAVTGVWLDWGLELAGRRRGPRDAVFYLGAPPHRPSEAPVKNPALQRVLNESRNGRLIVSFIGTFSRVHNPRVMIEAARLLGRRSGAAGRALFVLAGDGPLRESLAHAASGRENVVTTGWLNAPEISILLGATAVGVVPFGFAADLFPNKAFTFLSAGIPLLTSDAGDLREIVAASGAGGSFAFDDPAALAGEIERFAASPEKLESARAAARRLFKEKFQSDPIYDAYAAHIEAVAGKGDSSFKGQERGTWPMSQKRTP